MRSLCRLFLFITALILAPYALGAQSYPVNPQASFYRSDDYLPDPAPPTFIDLSTYADGSTLYLFPRGRYMIDFSSGDVKDVRGNYWFMAMFTTDTFLAPPNAQVRLHGVQSNMPEAFVPPSPGGLDRNVPYDFVLSGDVVDVVKPVGAKWLAVGIFDDVYYDNTVADPASLEVYVSATNTDDPDPGNCNGMRAYNLRCVDGNANIYDPDLTLTPPTTSTPEPATNILMASGVLLLGIGVTTRKRRLPECTPEQYRAEVELDRLASME